MSNYDQFYKKLGTRMIRHFLEPIVIDANTFIFPSDSVLHWFKVTNVIETINKKISYLSTSKSVTVSPVLTYNPKNIVGNPVSVKKDNEIIKIMAKAEKSYKILKPNELSNNIPNNVLHVYSYGGLNHNQKYVPHQLALLYKFNNTLHTLVETINNTPTGKNVFINIDIPFNMLNRNSLDKYSKGISAADLKKIVSANNLMVIELWKLLNPSTRKDSILNNINTNMLDKVDLLFTIDNKVTVVKLQLLLSLVKDYNINTPLQRLEYGQVQQLLYILMYNINNLKPIRESMLKESSFTDLVIQGSGDVEKNAKSVDLDDIINNDIIEEDDIDLSAITDYEDFDDSYGDELTNTDLEDFQIETSADRMNLDMDDIVEFEDLDSILYNENDIELLKIKIEKLAQSKVITNNNKKSALEILDKQATTNDPYGKGKLKDTLDISKDNYNINEDDVTIKDTNVVFDKRMNKNTIKALDKVYLDNQYKKDLIRMVYGIQSSGVLVTDYEITKEESILGSTEEHKISLKTLTGRASTIKLYLPTIDANGSFTLSGNKYIMRKQRSDLWRRKISATTVTLTSYYGKLFIDKAYYKKDDLGFWLRNQMIYKYENDSNLKNLVLGSVNNTDAKLPKTYGYFSRYVKSFIYKGVQYSFDYKNRVQLIKTLDNDTIKKIENDTVVICGAKGNDPVVMDMNNRIFLFKNNTFTEMDDLVTMLDLDLSVAPLEFAVIGVYKVKIPLVILMSYYVGLDNILKVLKVNYRTEDANARVKLEPNEYRINFSDRKLVITKRDDYQDLILSGLTSIDKITRQITYDTLNNKNKFTTLFSKLELNLLVINEIKLMETLFIDPITLSNLKLNNEPTSFTGMMIKACEMLVDDNYVNPNNIKEMVIKGYERIAGLLYSVLVKSIKEHENRSFFSKSSINVDPYILIKLINEDSTTVLIDDLNPMASMKQTEDVTYLGAGGRSSDSMNRDTRIMDKSEIGVISEGSKDSGDVGVSAYLSANPVIENVRGEIGDFDIKEKGWGSVLSTSGLLTPFALTDDVKRLNFASIMNSHVIPIKNMRAPYVRTGYESIIAIRASDKFVISAVEDGSVIDVTENSIKVKYKSGKEVTYPMRSWTSKEESSTTYTHYMVTNLYKGAKFSKDDALVYDSLFFEVDIFNRNRVIYKQGDVITVALTEDTVTHEDSAAISRKMTKHLATVVTKTKSVVVDKSDNILNAKKVGDTVNPNDTLFSITDELIAGQDLDARTLSIIQELKTSSPKSKLKGTITRIEVRYNCELNDMSDTLKKLAIASDKEFKLDTGFTGKVNSSYSINGIPLKEDEVEIKMYITVDEGMGMGDKAIFGNQLKFTVGEVFDYDIHGEDGIEVDALFSSRSVAARIVNSPALIGTTSMILEKVTEKAIEMYFGKK